MKQLAEQSGLTVLQPERLRDEGFLEALRALDADLGVVAAYGKILTDAVLAVPRLGLINVHASLLPKYRGAAPIHRAVMAGETVTGVTIMRVVKALDAGPMISSATAPDRRDETSAEVERDIARIGARAARRGGRRDGRGARVGDAAGRGRGDLRAQDREDRRHHRLVAAGARDSQSDSRPASVAARLLRSSRESAPSCSDPKWNGSSRTRARCPAPFSTRTRDRFTVQTGDGVLRVLMLQREGRRPLSAREFLAGRRIEPGARFLPSSAASMIAPARTAAFTALREVNAGRADLPAALASVRPTLQDERDRALATDLVTGTLRWQRQLDYLIEHLPSARSPSSTSRCCRFCAWARISCFTSIAFPQPRP